MKKLLLILIIFICLSLNGFEFVGFQRGLYLDVKTSVYKVFEPIEKLTNGYIQIDSNNDFKFLEKQAQQCALMIDSVLCD